MAPNPSHPGQYAPAPAGATPPYQQAADGYGLAPAPVPSPAHTWAPAPASAPHPVATAPVGHPPATFSGPLRATGSYFIDLFNFTKPATRSQYWWIAVPFLLAPILVFYFVHSLPIFEAPINPNQSGTANGIRSAIYDFIGVAVAMLAATITHFIGILSRLSLQTRRLRDAGFSPWWVLLSLGTLGDLILPLAFASIGLPPVAVFWIGTVVVEILCLTPSKRVGNRYLRPKPAPTPVGYTPAPAPATH